jgi:hypothetical protein
MHTWVSGWDWLWMTLMMGFWLVVLGASSSLRCGSHTGRRRSRGQSHERHRQSYD